MTLPDWLSTGYGDGENWAQDFAGAGPLDSATQAFSAFQSGDGASGVANTGSALLQGLGFMTNPVETLATSAIGWFIEHFGPLNYVLDITTGDPNKLTEISQRFQRAAKDADQIAADHFNALKSEVPTYIEGGSKSSVEFQKRMEHRGAQLNAVSGSCASTSNLVLLGGFGVSTTRGFLRDMLSLFIFNLCKKAVVAMAAAPMTGGASISALFTDTMITVAKVTRDCGDELANMTQRMTKIMSKFVQQNEALGKILQPAWRQSILTNAIPSAASTVEKVLESEDPSKGNQAEAEYNRTKTEAEQGKAAAEQTGPPWTTSGNLDDEPLGPVQ